MHRQPFTVTTEQLIQSRSQIIRYPIYKKFYSDTYVSFRMKFKFASTMILFFIYLNDPTTYIISIAWKVSHLLKSTNVTILSESYQIYNFHKQINTDTLGKTHNNTMHLHIAHLTELVYSWGFRYRGIGIWSIRDIMNW